jgi:recombination protein RecA
MSKKVHDEQDERREAAQIAIDQIKERFGEGSIMRFGEAKKMSVDAVSTSCLSLDLALGVLGVPRGRIVEALSEKLAGLVARGFS